jgi:tetratricopeptide (TPR) repeat protein
MSNVELRIGGAALLVCMVAVSALRAEAQPLPLPLPSPQAPSSTPDPRPWAASVAEDEQAAALALYDAGNREFVESRFAQALARYREAIRHWDHPAIRYNMAVCLIKLDQPLEARDHLERSLTYGAAALGAEAHAQALTYRKLLDAQLSRLAIACGEPGVQVMLDGKLLFTAPGAAEPHVLPGEHQVVAIRPGFFAASRTLLAVAGKRLPYDVPALERRTAMVRRWAAWKPWAVIAGGAALAGLGAVGYLAAKHDYDAYDRGIAANCLGAMGCDAAMLATLTELRGTRDRADRDQVIAFSLFSAAGAAVLAGAVGLIVNQPRAQTEPSPAPIVTPVPAGAAMGMRWRF